MKSLGDVLGHPKTEEEIREMLRLLEERRQRAQAQRSVMSAGADWKGDDMRNVMLMMILTASVASAEPNCIGQDWCPAASLASTEVSMEQVSTELPAGLVGLVSLALAVSTCTQVQVQNIWGDQCCSQFFWSSCETCCIVKYNDCLNYCAGRGDVGGECDASCEWNYEQCSSDCSNCTIENPI